MIVSPDTERSHRIPPGQTRTRKWPALDAWGPPDPFDPKTWTLKVFGLVNEPFECDGAGFAALPRVQVFSDFHCVTRWSRLGNLWEGVSAAEILRRVCVKPEARFVILHGLDNGWTTNLPLGRFAESDVLLADRHDGEPLSIEHGGPVRAIVPRLYAWKSAKWLCGVEFCAEDRPGYWERGGYHELGDPWREQRFQ